MAVETPTTLTIRNVGPKGPKQFQGLFNVIPFTFNFEEDSIAAGAASGGIIAVTGAVPGDLVLASLVQNSAELMVSGNVTTAGNVQINVYNADIAAADTSTATVGVGRGIVLHWNENVYDELVK